MRPEPSLVATDLDGTLLRSDGSVGGRTLTAMEATVAGGARVVFVTGRPPRWLHPVVDATGHRGVTICANGALVVDTASGTVVAAHPFDRDAGLVALRRLRALDPALRFGVEWVDGFAHEAHYPHRTRVAPGSPVGPDIVSAPEELFARPVLKLLARHDSRSSEDLTQAVADDLAGLATVTHSTDGLLELSAAGVTKASALREVAAADGTRADRVVAFGDMPNDVAMLEWAGWSVAVANAHHRVRAVADEITASNDDDGVGRVLERWFPLAGTA